MADKTQNININYKFNTSEIDKAAQSLAKANAATNQLQQSAQKSGSAIMQEFNKSSKSVVDMQNAVARLKASIESTPKWDVRSTQQLSREYQLLNKQLTETTKSLFGVAKAQKEVDKSTQGSSKGIAQMITGFKALAGVAAATMLADIAKSAVELTLEMSTLQGQVEGVERGFVTAFANSGEILEGLRQATHGTISDFELMKRSLQATNLGVPVENLAVLFEFAAARAQQTGESVDYLVDSIVRGIGRKSPLVLDNLGISVTALREKFNGVSIASVSVAEAAKGVTEIAKEQLTKMGGYAKTAETEVKALGTAWENFKVQLAKRVEASWITEFITEAINNANRLITAEQEIRDRREQTHGEITFGQMMDYWKANIKGAEDMKKAIEDQIKKEEELKKVTSSRLFILKEQMANIPKSERLGDPFQNALKGAVKFKSELDEIDIVIRLLVAELAKMGGEEKDFMNLAKLRKQLEELKRVREEDIEITNTKAYEANKRSILQLDQRILKIDDVLKWEQQWNDSKQQSAFLLSKETDELEKVNKAFDKWADKMGEGERNPSMFGADQIFDREAFNAKETIDTDALDAEMAEKGEQVGMSAWKEFWTRFRLGAKRQGGDSSEMQQDMEDAITELELTGIDIFADQLKSQSDMEAQAFDARIKRTKQFFDEQQQLAGNNEKAKDLLRILEDRKIKDLRTRQFIAEQKAAKQRALIDGAAAIVKTFATVGWPAGAILAIAQAAATASQIAIIDRQQPRFAKGVIDLQGPGTSTSDSIPARLSKHESVMTAWETKNAGGILKEIRAKKLDDRVLKSLREGRNPVVQSVNDVGIIKAIRDIKQPDVIMQSGIVYKATKKSDDYISKQRAKSIRI